MKLSEEFSPKAISKSKMKEISESGDAKWMVYLAAKEYISQGFFLLPLRKNSKFMLEKEHHINYGSASKNPDVVEKWFHPMTGKFAGYNIGIATGREGGLFVVDVDRHGPVDGFKSLKDAITENEYNGLINSVSQTTPNNGSHHIFYWQENASSSTEKIAKGVDTRGGTSDACKGHIVVFPSTIDGKMYEWNIGGEITSIPPWVMEKMGVNWKSNPTKFGSGSSRGNENVGTDDEEQVVPIEQVSRMLGAVDPNDLSYDEWLKVGQAVNSQHPTKEGFALWDDWSKRGDRYKSGECDVRWRGFDPTGPIRIGSLFYYAKDKGWEPEKGDKKGSKIDELVERINSTYAIVVTGGKVKVLREKNSRPDPSMSHYDLLGINDFTALTQNDVMLIENNKGETKPVQISKVWLGHEGRRTYHNGMGLFPDNKVPEGYYNIWNGFSVTPAKGDCDLFTDHVFNIICSGNETLYIWLMDWCADLMQDPANPKGTAVVMRGDEGAGKGTLADTLGMMLGSHYVHLIDESHLTSNFNSHMMDALFIFADEITWGGNVKSSGKLKGMVTEKYLVGERKGVDAVGYKNMTHLMIASNGAWVVPAGANSRRWLVLDVSNAKAKNSKYFGEIVSQLNNGGREALLYELLNRKITSDLRTAPETNLLNEQRIRSSESDTFLRWWISCLEMEKISVADVGVDVNENSIDWPEQVMKAELYASYEAWCLERRIRPEQITIFYTRTTKLGLRSIRKVMGGVKKVIYSIPKHEMAVKLFEANIGIKLHTRDEDEDEE